jgi:membrane protein implicated in regulation of membrane protease activity
MHQASSYTFRIPMRYIVSTIGWLLFSLVLLVIEMVTPGLFYFACFAVGALIAALAVWLGAGPFTSWIIFFGCSSILILVVAPIARRWMKRLPPSPVGLDSMTGQRARVVEALDPATGKGQVRLENAAFWRAISDVPIATDSWVEIVEVVGTRLRVRLHPDEPSSKE